MAFQILPKTGNGVHVFHMDEYKKNGKKVPAQDRSFVEVGKTSADGRTKVAPAMATNKTHVLIWK